MSAQSVQSLPRPTPDAVDLATVARHEHHWHDGPVDEQATPPTFVRACCRCPVTVDMQLAADVQGAVPDGCGAYFPDTLRPRVWVATGASMAAWDAVFRVAAGVPAAEVQAALAAAQPPALATAQTTAQADATLDVPLDALTDAPPPDLAVFPVSATGDPPA